MNSCYWENSSGLKALSKEPEIKTRHILYCIILALNHLQHGIAMDNRIKHSIKKIKVRVK